MVPSLSKLDCESCQLGKHSRATFSPGIEGRSESIFSLVHFNIWGPSRVSSTLGFVILLVLLMIIQDVLGFF